MKTVTTCLLLLTTYVLAAQKPDQHLPLLKEGVLLIQLKTSNNQIESLLARGMEKAANAIRLKNEAYHRALQNAFNENYRFSRFAFFYNTDTDAIIAGSLEGKLYNSDGRQINPQHDDLAIYILEVGKFTAAGEFSSIVNTEGFIIKKIEGGKAIPINGKPPFFFPAPTTAPTNARKEKIFNRYVRLFSQQLEVNFQRVARKYRRKKN